MDGMYQQSVEIRATYDSFPGLIARVVPGIADIDTLFNRLPFQEEVTPAHRHNRGRPRAHSHKNT